MANITKQTPADLSIIWAASGDTLRPTTTKIGVGWEVEIPPRQWFNWLDNKQDAFIAHVNQHGMPLWDSSTEYQNATSYVIGSNGVIYRCIQTHTNKDPVTAGDAASFWVQAFDPFDTSYTKAESDNLYLAKTANLSDLTNAATARTNLSVYSKTEADGLFLDAASNLSDLANTTTARTNLGVYSTTQVDALTAQATETVRGTAEVATDAEAQAWASDTVMITALKLNRALKGANQGLTADGYQKLPGGLILQWGFSSSGVQNTDVTITFPVAFTTSCFGAFPSAKNTNSDDTKNIEPQVKSLSAASATFYLNSTESAPTALDGFYWFAIGI